LGNAHLVGRGDRRMKGIIFWDITPCSPLSTEVSEEHIVSIFRVEKISWTKTSVKAGGRLGRRGLAATRFHAGFLFSVFFDLEDGDDIFLRNFG
jgi:hypothetical protein